MWQLYSILKISDMLGVVTPSMAAFCATVKLRGRFISRSCLEHPPERRVILAFWAFDAGGWQGVNAFPLHDLERGIRASLFFFMFFWFFFLAAFCLEAAFRAGNHPFIRTGPETCFALWTKTQYENLVTF
jgi:hypothetical protein